MKRLLIATALLAALAGIAHASQPTSLGEAVQQIKPDQYVAVGGEIADGCHKYQQGQRGYAVHVYGPNSPDAKGYSVPKGCK